MACKCKCKNDSWAEKSIGNQTGKTAIVFLGVLTVMAYKKLSENSVTAHNQSQQSFNIQHNNSALVTKGDRIEAFKTAWDFFFNKLMEQFQLVKFRYSH